MTTTKTTIVAVVPSQHANHGRCCSAQSLMFWDDDEERRTIFPTTFIMELWTTEKETAKSHWWWTWGDLYLACEEPFSRPSSQVKSTKNYQPTNQPLKSPFEDVVYINFLFSAVIRSHYLSIHITGVLFSITYQSFYHRSDVQQERRRWMKTSTSSAVSDITDHRSQIWWIGAVL